MLELHYDEVHTTEWVQNHNTKRAPARDSEFKVFNKVVQLHRQRPNQQLTLPTSVKRILRCPADELVWDRLEMLRNVVVAELEGERDYALDSRDAIEKLARAIEQCASDFPDLVGSGSTLPAGVRVCLNLPDELSALNIVDQRRHVALSVRKHCEGVHIRVKTRPRDTPRAATMDPFSESLFEVDTSLQELAHTQGLSIEEVLDRLLLSLWDALFLSQSIQWTEDNVANLPSDEANELARWFLRGQAVGAKPIFDGICAMCGALLCGSESHSTSMHNRVRGPPLGRDGDPIVTAGAEPDADAQPPFLLLFSP